MKKALIFGGAGQLGYAVANRLLENNWQCHVVSSAGRPIDPILLNKGAIHVPGHEHSRAETLKQTRQTFDSVFDPTSYDDNDARDLGLAQGSFGAAVAVSSSSVYADEQGRTLDEARENGFPVFHTAMPESTPTVAASAQNYSTKKVAMENVFRSFDTPVSILRPCAIYGKLARHPREWWFIKRALDKRSIIPVAWNADSLFHTSSTTGIASLTEICFNNPDHRTLNVADPDVLSVRQIAKAIGHAIGIEFNLLAYEGDSPPPHFVGSTPWSVERPFTLDVSAALSLGWDGGNPYEYEVRDVCNWILHIAKNEDWKEYFTQFLEYGHDPFNYVAEDQMFARLR